MKKKKELKKSKEIETGFPKSIWGVEDYLFKLMKRTESKKESSFKEENKLLLDKYGQVYAKKLDALPKYKSRV